MDARSRAMLRDYWLVEGLLDVSMSEVCQTFKEASTPSNQVNAGVLYIQPSRYSRRVHAAQVKTFSPLCRTPCS